MKYKAVNKLSELKGTLQLFFQVVQNQKEIQKRQRRYVVKLHWM